MLVSDIKDNLIDVLSDRYTFCQNTRESEYAVYDDFEERFIKKSDPKTVLEGFLQAFLSIPDEKISGFFWLVGAFNIQVHQVIPKILNQNLSKNKKDQALKFFLNRLAVWPESAFSNYTSNEKKMLLNEIRNSNLSLSDAALNFLDK